MKKKALAYRVERMRPGERWKKPPKFLAKHPLDKVPEIEDGDGLIFDLTVINAYLEEAYPNPPLMLRGALERAQARQLENFCDEAVLVADLPALWVPYWSPPEQRDSAGMERGRALCPILSAPSARRSLCVVTSVWPM